MALVFSESTQRRVSATVKLYPERQAALLPVLHIAQREFGQLSPEVIDLVSRTLELPESHVYGVVTFYTMFHQEKHGRHELLVCTNVSCMLKGGYEILAHLERRLGIKAGQTTPDGMFTLIEEECLAACADAPMMICGDEYHLRLDAASVDRVIDRLRTLPAKEIA